MPALITNGGTDNAVFGGIAAAAVGAPGANGALLTDLGVTFAIGTGGGGGGGVIQVFAAQQINTADPTKVSPLPSK